MTSRINPSAISGTPLVYSRPDPYHIEGRPEQPPFECFLIVPTNLYNEHGAVKNAIERLGVGTTLRDIGKSYAQAVKNKQIYYWSPSQKNIFHRR